jgi:transcriptional regulator with XRE-family HTH domain
VSMPINAIVVANVRRLRLTRGWSVQHLAEKLAPFNVPLSSHHTFHNWEGGRRRTGVTVDELVALAAALNIDQPWSLAVMPSCGACHGAPPAGYACLSCGQHGQVRDE